MIKMRLEAQIIEPLIRDNYDKRLMAMADQNLADSVTGEDNTFGSERYLEEQMKEPLSDFPKRISRLYQDGIKNLIAAKFNARKTSSKTSES
ncbi:MAG: hypothetical protein LBD41_00105 [Clostridiales Family XIII bacterium]|jgi:hypothetical protein|nr:hypothetical protein [Clostridiales Family XIII bacterium]